MQTLIVRIWPLIHSSGWALYSITHFVICTVILRFERKLRDVTVHLVIVDYAIEYPIL